MSRNAARPLRGFLVVALGCLALAARGSPPRSAGIAEPAPPRQPRAWVAVDPSKPLRRQGDGDKGGAFHPRRVRLASSVQEGSRSRFQINFHDFPPEAKKAFQAAADIWASLLASDVPIVVDAYWKDMGDPDILVSADPTTFMYDFPNARQKKTWYPIALANKLAKQDLKPEASDIEVGCNKTNPKWYYGTDGNVPKDRYDLMTVVLHGLGHGLGFIGSMDYIPNRSEGGSGTGRWGLSGPETMPLIFDRFTENGVKQKLLDTKLFPNSSEALGEQLTSGKLFFNGQSDAVAGLDAKPRLYAPRVWEVGLSYPHLDEGTYPRGDPDSLMTPLLDLGEAIHSPGPITRAILNDLGW